MEGSDVNDIRFPGQVTSTEKQTPTVAACGKPAQAMQAAEMISGVPGAGGRVVETQEGLVLARQHGLDVGKEFVAELGTVDMRAEPGQLVAAPAPTCHKTLACHGGTRMLLSKRRPRSLRAGAALSHLYCANQRDVLSQVASFQCSQAGEEYARGVTGAVTPMGQIGDMLRGGSGTKRYRTNRRVSLSCGRMVRRRP